MRIAQNITAAAVLDLVLKALAETPVGDALLVDPAVKAFIVTNFDWYENVECIAYHRKITLVVGSPSREMKV